MTQKRKCDLLLAAGILLLAGLLYWSLHPGGSGAWAVVAIDGEEIARFDLSQEQTVTLGGEGFNILQISNGGAAVIEANCGDHTCIRTGEISREGESIICLPHHLIVRIEGGEALPFDAAVR